MNRKTKLDLQGLILVYEHLSKFEFDEEKLLKEVVLSKLLDVNKAKTEDISKMVHFLIRNDLIEPKTIVLF